MTPMRTALAVVVPWLVWGILDNVIYQILLAVSPDAFNEQSIPATTVMLVERESQTCAGVEAERFCREKIRMMRLSELGIDSPTGFWIIVD